jgi:hypothetical protein
VGFQAFGFNVKCTFTLNNHDIGILDFGREVFPWPHETGNIRNRIRRKYHTNFSTLKEDIYDSVYDEYIKTHSTSMHGLNGVVKQLYLRQTDDYC